jgi:hypothetical protein
MQAGHLNCCPPLELHAMLRHQRQLVFVTGELGIGKTALVDEACFASI